MTSPIAGGFWLNGRKRVSCIGKTKEDVLEFVGNNQREIVIRKFGTFSRPLRGDSLMCKSALTCMIYHKNRRFSHLNRRAFCIARLSIAWCPIGRGELVDERRELLRQTRREDFLEEAEGRRASGEARPLGRRRRARDRRLGALSHLAQIC